MVAAYAGTHTASTNANAAKLFLESISTPILNNYLHSELTSLMVAIQLDTLGPPSSSSASVLFLERPALGPPSSSSALFRLVSRFLRGGCVTSIVAPLSFKRHWGLLAWPMPSWSSAVPGSAVPGLAVPGSDEPSGHFMFLMVPISTSFAALSAFDNVW